MLKRATELAQECIGQSPVILLGSGASAAHGVPGMWPLGEHLRSAATPADCIQTDIDGWNKFCEMLPGSDLEKTLTEVTLTSRMTKHVVSTTWDFLNPFDLDILHQLCANRKLLALTKLYDHLFRSTAREIQVVTPNYDRLAEYAAEAGGFSVYTGFTFGTLATRATSPSPKIYCGKFQARTVNVWKVHGSFGWFASPDGFVIGLPPMHKRPNGMDPYIITPGIEKYRRTHDEPFRTTMQNADSAMRTATAFLCIGYGFNDEHLQPLLVERCNSANIPLILVTHSISNRAHEFFQTGKCQRYMALEKFNSGTKMFCNENPEGVELPDSECWQLSQFLNLII